MCCGCCPEGQSDLFKKIQAYGGIVAGILFIALGAVAASQEGGCEGKPVPMEDDCDVSCITGGNKCVKVEGFVGALMIIGGLITAGSGVFATMKLRKEEEAMPWTWEIGAAVGNLVAGIMAIIMAFVFPLYWVPTIGAVVYGVGSLGFMDTQKKASA